MYCPAGNATNPIWRVLTASQGISCWTPLKPQRSNPNPNPLANQLWSIESLTPPTPLIITHRLPVLLESLMPLKNGCSIHARCSKSSLKHSIRFCYWQHTQIENQRKSLRVDCWIVRNYICYFFNMIKRWTLLLISRIFIVQFIAIYQWNKKKWKKQSESKLKTEQGLFYKSKNGMKKKLSPYICIYSAIIRLTID